MMAPNSDWELLKPFPSIRVGQSGWRLMKGVYDIRWNI